MKIKFPEEKRTEGNHKKYKKALERILAKRKHENLKDFGALSELKYFDFPKTAKKYAAQKMQGVKKTMNSIPYTVTDDEKPLAYEIADIVKEKFTVYAVNAMSRIFVQLSEGGYSVKTLSFG